MSQQLFQKLKKHQNQVENRYAGLFSALYSYLQQVQDFIPLTKDQTSNQKRLLDFVFLCLALPYWRQHRETFFHQLQALLTSLDDSSLNKERIERLSHLQIYFISSQKDLYEVVKKQHVSKIKSGDQWRVVPDGPHRMVCLHLSSDKTLSVTSYCNYGVIYKGELLPLPDGTSFQYSPKLELIEHQLHIFKKAQNGFYFIKKTEDGFYITGLSGITFAPESFDHVKMLEELPQVFYALKRLEQFFVDRATDPYYKGLVHLLEFQIQYLEKSEKVQLEECRKIYEKVRTVFEAIFQDDKLLMVLLKQLHRQIGQREISNNGHKNTNQSSLSPEWGL